MKTLVLLIVILVGGSAGAGLGLVLRKPEVAASGQASGADHADQHQGTEAEPDSAGAEGDLEFVRLNNQFIVPLFQKDKVTALMVLSLSIGVESSATETIYDLEPRIRDAFLQVMFDHANIGGFAGKFTHAENLETLKRSLLEEANRVIGPGVHQILFDSIARQDI